MAKLTNEEIIASLKEMSVLELNELVKAVEEEFGVTAAAPVAAAAAPAEEGPVNAGPCRPVRKGVFRSHGRHPESAPEGSVRAG